mgnify:CR=1 FL=1
MKKYKHIILTVVFLATGGCATFSPPIHGLYPNETIKNTDASKVDVLFIFKHYEQTMGIDAVPKLTRPQYNFDDIFAKALVEINNIDSYNSVTVNANDINDIGKREKLNRLMKEGDYTIEVSIKKQKSFAKFFFSVLMSSVSATVIPMRYRYHYSFEIKVFDNHSALVKTYNREAVLNKWVETMLGLIYPFYTEKKEKEVLYVACLRDIFRQIDTEKILDPEKIDKTTRTIYCHKEISELILKIIPEDAIGWKGKSLNEWIHKKDIAIVIHFPNDGITQAMSNEAFKLPLETLDQKTEQEGLLFWVDNEEKYPLLLISAQNETVLKAQLENNKYLKIVLNGMFFLKR